MSYSVLRAKDNSRLFSYAARFVEPYEAVCCSLMEQILKFNPNIYLIVTQRTPASDYLVRGVFTYGAKGETVLVCLPFQDQWVRQCLVSFFRGKSVFCLSGFKEYADFVYNILFEVNHKASSDVREMFFMSFTDSSSFVSTEKIIECGPDDVEELLPLQMDYMQVEVMPLNTTPSVPAEVLYLQRNVKEKKIYALIRNNKIVSKIHINASSPHYIQLGGVYTLKAYRGQGFAGCLVNYMTDKACRQGKKTVLFVKESNGSAIACYTRAGFTEIGKYTIVYYL